MRYLFYSCFTLFLISCNNVSTIDFTEEIGPISDKVDTVILVHNVEYNDSLFVKSFYLTACAYIPTSSDMDKSLNEDILVRFDSLMNYNSLSPNMDSVEFAVDILYLKEYLYHLQCCNQSYNIDIAKDERVQKMVDILTVSLGIDTTGRVEMIISTLTYKYFPKNLISMNPLLVKSIMDSIDIGNERIRIMNDDALGPE